MEKKQIKIKEMEYVTGYHDARPALEGENCHGPQREGRNKT